MRCPQCHHEESKVVDSRPSEDREAIRRRRECESCGHRFTTYEHADLPLPLVVKRDGSRQPFDRAKVLGGLARACKKRPVSADQMEALVREVERAACETGDPEIASTFIGERVMERLRELDAVAYVRFASVYRSFGTAEEFLAELTRFLDRR